MKHVDNGHTYNICLTSCTDTRPRDNNEQASHTPASAAQNIARNALPSLANKQLPASSEPSDTPPPPSPQGASPSHLTSLAASKCHYIVSTVHIYQSDRTRHDRSAVRQAQLARRPALYVTCPGQAGLMLVLVLVLVLVWPGLISPRLATPTPCDGMDTCRARENLLLSSFTMAVSIGFAF